jgi:hypothetical protein
MAPVGGGTVADDERAAFVTQGASQMAAWVLRLLGQMWFKGALRLDPHLFAIWYAACAGAVPPPDALRAQEPADTMLATDELLGALKDLRRQFGDETSGMFARLYLAGMSLQARVSVDEQRFADAVRIWQHEAEAQTSRHIAGSERNAGRLEALLGLDETEYRLLLFQLYRREPGFGPLLAQLWGEEEGRAARVLAHLLDVSVESVRDALRRGAPLVRSGLVRVRERPLSLDPPSGYLRAVLSEDSDQEEAFYARFLAPLAAAASTASVARLDQRDRDILLALLRRELPEDRGLHVLLYGPASVDKRDMVARLLATSGIEAFAVRVKDVPPADLSPVVYIAQAYMRRAHPHAVLLIERAEQALTGRSSSLLTLRDLFDDQSDDDAEPERASDEGLTTTRLRCVWLTDRSREMTERTLARFLFHAEARPGSRSERRGRVAAVVKEFGLTAAIERELAAYSLLGEHQVRQAATLAILLEDDPAQRELIIRRAVQQAQRVLGREDTEQLRNSVTLYSLDYLNVAGRFTPAHIVRALRQRPAGSLCFYGLPGAGKTQLAEYIAVELDLPLLRRSASELLSMWLGETEKHLAAMFDEAEAENALLFLDEADSFLRDRTLARAEWSVTQVNELLQRMERFRGVFIAATNLMRDVDPAALRRFTWKLEFLALRPEQAWRMFLVEAGINQTTITTVELDEFALRLGSIPNLTPGDFATVKRQSQMLGEELAPAEWLEQLAVEAKLKMAGFDRTPLGFA